MKNSHVKSITDLLICLTEKQYSASQLCYLCLRILSAL